MDDGYFKKFLSNGRQAACRARLRVLLGRHIPGREVIVVSRDQVNGVIDPALNCSDGYDVERNGRHDLQ